MPSEQIIKFKSKLILKFFTTIINYTTSPTLTFHCSEEQTQQYINASNFGKLSISQNIHSQLDIRAEHRKMEERKKKIVLY